MGLGWGATSMVLCDFSFLAFWQPHYLSGKTSQISATVAFLLSRAIRQWLQCVVAKPALLRQSI